MTSFQTANQLGFKPFFNELDVVGLVVFVAQQPNKNSFQTAVLSDGNDIHFILFNQFVSKQLQLIDVQVGGSPV